MQYSAALPIGNTHKLKKEWDQKGKELHLHVSPLLLHALQTSVGISAILSLLLLPHLLPTQLLMGVKSLLLSTYF